MRSHVHLLSTGGTIAAHFDGGRWAQRSGQALVDELGPLPVPVQVEDVAMGPSANFSVDDMLVVISHVERAIRSGAGGVVVSHGTDTLELTAFLTEVMLGPLVRRVPVVFTGAMRVHSHHDPDGPDNLLDAITVASSTAALGCEVLVCFDGCVHAASKATLVGASSLDAFTSAPFPPLGSFADSSVLFLADAPERPAATAMLASMPLVTCYPGMPAAVVERAVHGERGIVIEAFGDLNVPRNLCEPIHRAGKAGVLVVLAARPFTDTLVDTSLASLGAIGAGGLTPQKARLAAMAALGSTRNRDDAVRFFHRFVQPFDAGERRA